MPRDSVSEFLPVDDRTERSARASIDQTGSVRRDWKTPARPPWPIHFVESSKGATTDGLIVLASRQHFSDNEKTGKQQHGSNQKNLNGPVSLDQLDRVFDSTTKPGIGQ